MKMLFSLCAGSRPSRRHVRAVDRQAASFRTVRSSRQGFTLVELLVVMTIMGLLMSLLIPAVNSARESARRGICLNNLKQLSTAAMKYNDRRRELPGYVNVIGKSSTAIPSATPTTGVTANVPNRLGTWAMMLFPEIERSDVFQTWTTDPAVITTPATPNPSTPYIALFVCPSDPPDDTSTNPTPLSYIANCGIPDNPSTLTANTTVTITPVDSAPSPSTLPARSTNGMFYDRYSPKYSTTLAPIPDVSSSLDHIPDGASNTLMFSENFMPTSKDINNGFLYRVYYPPFNPTVPVNDYPHVPQAATSAEALTSAYSFEADIGFVWDPRSVDDTQVGTVVTPMNPADPRVINGDKNRKLVANYPQNQATFGYYYSRPSSSHLGGVNVTTCGGECFFLRDDIDYRVYEQLMTPDGKHSAMQPIKSTYVLSDTDYK